jgi:L-aspartate semialdehyde sulfurtransferase ferredoxin
MAEKHVRLTFSPQLIKEPLIYELGRDFAVITNIRMADVDAEIGWVVLGLEGDEAEIERALEWARSKGVRVDDATLGDVVEG